jgi:hypothetical protein
MSFDGRLPAHRSGNTAELAQKPGSNALDSHQHFGSDPAHQVWMTDRMEVLRRDYLPAEFEPLLRRSNSKEHRGCRRGG